MPRILSAIKRWFIPSRVKPYAIQFGVFKGLKMNLDLHHHTQIVLGLSEREVFRYLRSFARGAKTGIDIGARDGEYSLYYLTRPNMKHVLAIDPDERFPTDLAANLALNGRSEDPRLRMIKKFVANEESADHCTLDSVAADLEGPCVVKIDVDGGEGSVLEGAGKILDRKDVSWIIETHTPELERQCEQILKSNGYSTRIVKKAWWRLFLPELRPIPHNRWLIGWRDNPQAAEAIVQQRVFAP